MAMGSNLLPSLCLLTLFLVSGTSAQPAPSFKCTATATCKALVGYIPAASTTLGAVQSLFEVKTLRSLLGVNNLPLSTPPSSPVPANHTVRIPIPCRCFNGTGLSNLLPSYSVVKDDTLSKIASVYFSGLVSYQQIQAANRIKNATLIKVGEKLWVPLPCSCDEVEGEGVVHYAHVVAPGSSVDGIAAEFGMNAQTLMSVNGITDPKKLMAGQVLDVPLKACSSSISNSSADSRMLVANGTYVFTANNCIMCKCDSTFNFTVQCEASGIKAVNWATCPAAECPNNLSLGNSTQTSSCSRSNCAYSGYRNHTILTTLVDHNTCAAERGLSHNQGCSSNIHGRWSLTLPLAVLAIQLALSYDFLSCFYLFNSHATNYKFKQI